MTKFEDLQTVQFNTTTNYYYYYKLANRLLTVLLTLNFAYS